MLLPALLPWSTASAFAFALPVLQQPPTAPSAPAAATPPERIELPTRPAPGESRLIEIKTATSSSFHIDAAGKATEMKQRDESTTWIVDTLLDPATQPKDHVWTGRRRFVKAQASRDGVVDDPQTNGFEATAWSDTANRIHLESATERSMTQEVMQDLLHAVEAFGLGAGVMLPSSAAVGAEFDLPFATLAPWCLTVDGKATRANAHLRFESVDPAKNVAHFKGPVHVEEEFERSAEELDAPFGMKGTGTYDGDVALEYDVAARHVARIVCHAKASFEGVMTGKATAKVTGTNVIESTITCTTGAAAASALNQKPQFRDVPHEVADAGVSIALPSHFAKYPVKEPNCTGFRSLLLGKDAVASIVIIPLALPGKTLKEAGAGARKQLAALPGATVKDATARGSLGTASATEYTTKNAHGLHAIFQLEPGRFVALQCECPEAAWAERSKEWSKYFQALKKLPAAK